MSNIDFSEPHAMGHGFDNSLCGNCEHHDTDGLMDTCDLCGCPTANAAPMNLLSAPPESCPYLEEHHDPDATAGSIMDAL